MKLFGKIIYWLVFVAILATAFLVIGSSMNIGGMRMFYVLSPSMDPAIGAGSLIFTRTQDEYTVGDIVTRSAKEREGISVTHRIYESRLSESGETIFILKGDANDEPDEEIVFQKSIIGRVFAHIPFLGYIVSFAKTPIGFILLVVIPVTIIIYDEFLNIRDEVKKRFSRSKEIV